MFANHDMIDNWPLTLPVRLPGTMVLLRPPVGEPHANSLHWSEMDLPIGLRHRSGYRNMQTRPTRRLPVHADKIIS